MYIPKKMRLGAFKNVRCVSTEDIYKRVGPRGLNIVGSNDGSDYSERIPMNQSKLEQLQAMANEDYRHYANEMAERQRQAESAKQESTQEPAE